MAKLLSTAELFSLGYDKFRYFGLLWIGAVVELYTERNHFFLFLFFLSNWKNN